MPITILLVVTLTHHRAQTMNFTHLGSLGKRQKYECVCTVSYRGRGRVGLIRCRADVWQGKLQTMPNKLVGNTKSLRRERRVINSQVKGILTS